jgi:hypothetical protein
MNTSRFLLAMAVLGLAGASTNAVAVTIAGKSTAVSSEESSGKSVDAVISSIDAKRGVLVAGGRTYRFDPAAVGFSDDRKPPVAGGVQSLKNGSRVTLQVNLHGNLPQVLQIIAH